MDSFYELPRSAPQPSASAKVPIISSAPTVPEVSMIFPNRSKTTDNTGDSVYLSYKAWKDHHKNDNPPVNDNRGCSQNSQRKQLRFDKISLEHQAPEMSACPSNRPDPRHFTQNKNIPFDQIYMANIPNKQLELSILDSNPSAHMKNIENIDPNVPISDMPTRHYLNVEKVVTESKSNKARQDQFSTPYDSWFSKERFPRFRGTNESGITEKNRVVDLYHQKTVPTISSDTVSAIPRNAISTRDNVSGCHCQRDNNDQTIKDLLKIIQQLNEQIIILQKQVTTLLNNQVPSNPQKTVPTENYIFNEDYKTNLQSDQHHGFLPKKPGLQQISLDVMTSFEVAIRRPPNSNKMCNNLPYPPKICEITETESSSSNGNILDGIPKPNDTNLSFSLSETPQLQVREACPTPVSSIRVDMKDYSSDEDDEISNPAWTFYNNIMAQVNHILTKSGMQPTNIPPCEVEVDSNDVMKQKMMRKVKQTTLKHLKRIGVHIPSTETADEFNDPSMCNPNDVSFAVKQLLMKYLPNDQLSRVAHNKQGYHNVKQTANIKRRPEFSIATVQYMQKYNLLNEKPQEVSSPIRMFDPKPHFDRILDVTAIKKQPKLL